MQRFGLYTGRGVQARNIFCNCSQLFTNITGNWRNHGKLITAPSGILASVKKRETKQMTEYNRREVINLSLMSFLRLGTALPALAQTASRANQFEGFGSSGEINWNAFLEAVERTASAQGPLNQEYYVEKVAGLARALKLADPSLVRAYLSASRQPGLQPKFADLEHRTAFQITLITFERGQWLPLHDHPSMTGVMTCAAGQIDVRSFRLLEQSHETDAFVLQDEGAVRMSQGMVGTLTATKHNIHGLKAQSFAQVIDIFTPPYDAIRIRDSKYFQIVSPGPGANTVTARLLKTS
jgi:hypothetical protein